jgi:hypothetical protein
MPSRRATSPACVFGSAIAAIAIFKTSGVIFRGRPPRRPRARRRQPRPGALANQLRLEFGQGGKDAEHQLAVGRGGIDLGAGAGQDFQPDATLVELIDGVHEVLEIPTQAVELPDHQRISGLQGLQAGRQPWPIILAPGCEILVHPIRAYAGPLQCIALQIQNLTAITLRYADVSNQHSGRSSCPKKAVASSNLAQLFLTGFLVARTSINTPSGRCKNNERFSEAPKESSRL